MYTITAKRIGENHQPVIRTIKGVGDIVIILGALAISNDLEANPNAEHSMVTDMNTAIIAMSSNEAITAAATLVSTGRSEYQGFALTLTEN